MNVDSATLIILIAFVAVLVGLLVAVDRRWARDPAAPRLEPQPRLRSLTGVFTVAIWFGLVTASLHLALAFVNRYVRDHFLMVGPQIVWLAPLSYVLMFSAFAIVLAGLALARPGTVPFRLTSGAFAWLGLFGLLLPFHQLHQAAAALLCAGVAVQVSRVMARHDRRWLSAMRRTHTADCSSSSPRSRSGWQGGERRRSGWNWGAFRHPNARRRTC